jgi:hypothetical protein
MKHTVEMGSDAATYIPRLIQTDSCIQKLMEGWNSQTRRNTAWKTYKPTFIFSKYGKYAKNKEFIEAGGYERVFQC